MLRRFFGGIRDFLGGLGGGRELPPPPPEEPPSLPPPPEEPGDFAPEEPEEIPPEEPGTEERPVVDGEPVMVWISKYPMDTSEFTRQELRRKDYDNQADAIAYAKKIPVPTIVFKDEDGNWQIAIDYP